MCFASRLMAFLSAVALGWLLGAAPCSFAADGGSAPQGAPQPRLSVSWEGKLVAIDAFDADLAAVVKTLSEKSGVEISLFEGISGKVTLHEEKVPLETAVDRILAAAGQRNYLMVFDGGGLTKMTIVPRGSGGASDAVKRVKARGKLPNGKEIEYYPGEIWVALGGIPGTEKYLSDFIKDKETRHGLSFMKSVRVGYETLVKFRILNGRDVIEMMPEVGGSSWPNGLGPRSVEMPEEDYHVVDESLTDAERAEIAKDTSDLSGRGRARIFLQKNPFLKRADILHGGYEIPYREGEISFYISGSDASRITYYDILGLVHDEGGIVYRHGGSAGGIWFEALFPHVHTPEEHTTLINRLRSNEIFKRAKEKYTGVGPVYWSPPS